MNKPVAIPFAWYCAWLGKDDEPVWEQYEECHPASKEWDNFPDKIIPLYTHPVKELTDEEIIKTMVQFDVYSSDDHCLIEAGRAILKKASEK